MWGAKNWVDSGDSDLELGVFPSYSHGLPSPLGAGQVAFLDLVPLQTASWEKKCSWNHPWHDEGVGRRKKTTFQWLWCTFDLKSSCQGDDSFSLMAHTSRNSYEHSLKGKKKEFGYKATSLLWQSYSCAEILSFTVSQEPLLETRFILPITSHLKHRPILPPGSLNSLYSQWHIQRASGMARPILGYVRQVVSSSGYRCQLLSWKIQLDHCWDTRLQCSIMLFFLAHNVQIPCYKPWCTRRIFLLRPRELFWDTLITHMSRDLQNGAQDLYKQATLCLLP